MADLVAFLRARLDEDEADAKTAAIREGEHWTFDEGKSIPEVASWQSVMHEGIWDCDDPYDDCNEICNEMRSEGEHIARWDPARVLAEVAAKRAVLDEVTSLFVDGRVPLDPVTPALRVALAFAQVYAEHPDFDEAWRA